MMLPESVDDAPYRPIYTQEFRDLFASKKFRSRQQQIVLAIERICFVPERKSHLLDKKHGIDWRGKRDRKANGDIILIFGWCREWGEKGFRAQGINDCCGGEAENSNQVVFLALGSHKQVFKRG